MKLKYKELNYITHKVPKHNLKSQKAIQTNLHICSLAFTDEEFNRFICPTHTEPTEYIDERDLTVKDLDEEEAKDQLISEGILEPTDQQINERV